MVAHCMIYLFPPWELFDGSPQTRCVPLEPSSRFQHACMYTVPQATYIMWTKMVLCSFEAYMRLCFQECIFDIGVWNNSCSYWFLKIVVYLIALPITQTILQCQMTGKQKSWSMIYILFIHSLFNDTVNNMDKKHWMFGWQWVMN